MPKGGFRYGAGRPKGSKNKTLPAADSEVLHRKQKPLEYMLAVMNDPTVDETRRDRMAVAAAPYIHRKVADDRYGKKDEREARSIAAAVDGKFAAQMPPKLVVDNG